MSKLTKGTQIYLIDPNDDSLIEVTGIVSFNPGGAPADQIETTSLTDEAKTYERGMRTPGQATMEINADPTITSHVRLHELAQDDTLAAPKWAVGWSDGSADPTVDSNGDFVLPTSRTWYEFTGYIADFPFDFSTNSVVKSTVQIQRSGGATLTEKV